jgi:hypothetical protein
MLLSPWLDTSVPQDVVTIPTSIPPCGTYEVPGIITAFIKQEPGPRIPPGDPLIASDSVKIIAIIPRLLNWQLPEFLLESALTVQYPLELLPPVYLPTVSIGDEFTVQWKVSYYIPAAYVISANA